VEPGRSSEYHAVVRPFVKGSRRARLLIPAERSMPSRQERRSTERDAAKAAKAEAAAAAAALASVSLYASGDWTTQKKYPLFLRRV